MKLRELRPDLRFIELRGNISTRLDKVPEGGAIVMAVAALQILGLTERIAEAFEPLVMVPQVGQGAVAIECRAADEAALGACRAIEHPRSRRDVDVERAFLAELGGGCTLPVGAHVVQDPMDGTRALAIFLGLGDEPRRCSVALPAGSDEIELARAAAAPFVER